MDRRLIESTSNECFGSCFRCKDSDKCESTTKSRMDNNMNRQTYGKAENQQEHKERLDKEWLDKLPCKNCHPKMQKMCKAYNTFSIPDFSPVF